MTVAVLQCAGNGRAFYSQAATTKGTQWKRGGMAQVSWAGVRLQPLAGLVRLASAVPTLRSSQPEGRDSARTIGDDDFEQSVPLEDVLETALLATAMNGEPIPAIHGGPLRLVLPGYYGSMNVKWLSRLRFESEPSTNRHHAKRYRTFRERIVPGSAPEVTAENHRFHLAAEDQEHHLGSCRRRASLPGPAQGQWCGMERRADRDRRR